jgi:hypothetical protein
MITTKKMTAMILGLSLAGSVLACSKDGKDGFVPENDMYISVNNKSMNGGLTEEQFNAALDRVETIYAPIVAQHGGKLVVVRKWDDGTVNAYAQQQGKTWMVSMFGGLARHETITEDAMSLVICHELGHHLGGAPKVGASGPTSGGWWGGNTGATGLSWASNEGQADYFGTLKCLRKTFVNDDNAAIVKTMDVPEYLANACKKSTKGNKEDSALCIRTAMAGKSVSDLFSALSRLPETKFDTPDRSVVRTTDDNHPKAQCRLDTYFQASICDVSMNEEVSDTDETVGVCHSANGQTKGLRPLCWFKPSK